MVVLDRLYITLYVCYFVCIVGVFVFCLFIFVVYCYSLSNWLCCFWSYFVCFCFFVFSSRRRHTICALVTGVQTCALPICHWTPEGNAMKLKMKTLPVLIAGSVALLAASVGAIYAGSHAGLSARDAALVEEGRQVFRYDTFGDEIKDRKRVV